MFWLYAAYAGPQEFTSATIGTFFLQGRRVFPAAMVACAVCTAGAPRNLVTRFLQECGKLSYARPICSIRSSPSSPSSYRYSITAAGGAPVFGVAMCAPIAYLVNRLIEQPILARRRAVEGSTFWRCFCSLLQVAPISVGLIFLFPWADIGSQDPQLAEPIHHRRRANGGRRSRPSVLPLPAETRCAVWGSRDAAIRDCRAVRRADQPPTRHHKGGVTGGS